MKKKILEYKAKYQKEVDAETFWHSFTVFLWPFEAFCVRYWYILGLVYFAIELLAVFVWDLSRGAKYWHDIWAYFRNEHFQFSDLHYVFFSSSFWIYNAVMAGLFLALGLANHWQGRIPEFFQTLEQKGQLTDPHFEKEKAYQNYLSEYRRALLYGKGGVLTRPVVIAVVVFGSFIVVITNFVSGNIPDLRQTASSWNVVAVITQGLWDFETNVFNPLFMMYLITSFIWIMGATGLYIRQFLRRFPLQVQLAHPDHCGGFKFLGNFALNTALVILMVATLLAIYTIWRGYSFFSVGASIVVLFLIVISYIAFFVPVLAIHRKMLTERSAYENSIASRTIKIEEQINAALKKGDLSQLKTAKEEFDVVLALFPDTLGFPNWPFNWRILITFFSSQIIPILSFIVGISPVITDFFTKVFPFMSGH